MTTKTRRVAIASALYLAGYSVVSLVTGQSNVWVGDLAKLVPPLAFAGLCLALARHATGQVRLFWNLSAAHAVVWAVGQSVSTYYDVNEGRVRVISPTDPIFFLSSLPLAAALYGRPEQEKPRWLFDIIVLDIVLIGLFAAFAYVYFVVSLVVTGGSEDVYHTNLTHLLNARNFILAAWAAWLWRTARTEPWRRMLAIYCGGLTLTFAGGILADLLDAANSGSGSLWDLASMIPFAVLSLAAARAYDERLFTPAEQAPPLARLPVVSLIAVALLILIPTTDEIARRVLDVSPLTESLRTRLALTMMIPFGVVVVVREFLSRRALLRAGQQLVSTREELAQKEKLAAVGQLVSGVAHELNNPLQGVLGYAELLALSQKDAPESEELKAICENANRAAGIVRNLLTFAGRATPTRSWQQINGVVREAAQRRVPFLRMARTQLDCRLAERLPLVYLDAARFQQVVINLIENAEAAIDTGGEISIATRREPNPDRIVIEVSDNGSGVRVEDLSKIFDPFFTTRGVGEGTGLGLSVCYGIVREHGGLIRGENRDVGGAVFTIELPVTADSEQQDVLDHSLPLEAARREVTVDSLAEAVPANRKRRILVVDDEDSNATLVRRALDQAGYGVESTTLSRRALVMIERTAYDVVIADVRMPELNGQELYSRVCQIRPEMSHRFIFITGDIDSEDTLDFLERSRCGYFMKPFNLERLTSAVKTLVGDTTDDRIG